MLDPDTLIQHYLEGTINEAEAGQLHELLKAQPELGEKLLQHLEMDAMLRATKPPAACHVMQPARPPMRRSTFNRIMAMAACITLLATWLLMRGPKSNEESATAFVAEFKRGVDLEWENAVITPGTPLSPGLLKLKSGIAQIEFYQGARVAIEGPAEFQLISSSEASCTRGKLSAHVPPQAKGFRINTPKGAIVDLGTQFGLEVNATLSEVHVFQGEVELHKAGDTVKLLREGQAMSYAAGFLPLVAYPQAFASLNEINALAALAGQSQLQRWQAQSAKLGTDPSLKFHFDFQDDRASRSLRNHAPSGEDGSIVGSAWTEGRWPGKGALAFLDANDRVRLSFPHETRALTMAISVRVNELNPQFNSLMLSDGWGIQGKVHWQILNDGRIRLAVAAPSGTSLGPEYDSPVYFTPERFGSWVHLAVVLDPIAKEVRHYVNGARIASLPLTVSSALKIGNAELGNWNKVNNTSDIHIRHLRGTIDEFTLWNRALSDQEIDSLLK